MSTPPEPEVEGRFAGVFKKDFVLREPHILFGGGVCYGRCAACWRWDRVEFCARFGLQARCLRPAARGLLVGLVVFAPEDPVKGDLGAEDGEQEGEDAVAQVVEPGGVDDEGGGDNEGGEDEEECDPEHDPTQRPADGPFRAVLGAGSDRAPPHAQSFFAAFSVLAVPDFAEPLSEDSDLVTESPFVLAAGSVFLEPPFL